MLHSHRPDNQGLLRELRADEAPPGTVRPGSPFRKRASMLATVLAFGLSLLAAANAGEATASDAARRLPRERAQPRALRIREVQALRFGTIASEEGRRAEASLQPELAGVSVSGGAHTLGGDYGRAVIEVTGEPNASVTIRLPASVAIAPGVELRNLVSRPSWTTVLGSDGRAAVEVGGRLIIEAHAETGPLSVQFDVEVNYL